MKNFWQTLPRPFLVLAPMEDVTDHVFREVIYSISTPDVCMTEFTSSEALFSRGHDATIHRLKYADSQRPIVAQIWGRTPEPMYKAAQLVRELGFDGVDINMGCPGKTVTKLGSGAALIQQPKLAAEMIQAVKEGAGDMPVSVKTRIGYKKIATEEWIGHLLNQSIDVLTIHLRTMKDMSKVPARWDEMKKIVTLRNEHAPNTIIVGNGDIKDYAHAVEVSRTYSIEGIMIGRGVFTNPWVFEKVAVHRQRNPQEYFALLQKHILLFESTWGHQKNYNILKKFFKMYVRSFSGAHELRAQLMETKNTAEALELLAKNLL